MRAPAWVTYQHQKKSHSGPGSEAFPTFPTLVARRECAPRSRSEVVVPLFRAAPDFENSSLAWDEGPAWLHVQAKKKAPRARVRSPSRRFPLSSPAGNVL